MPHTPPFRLFAVWEFRFDMLAEVILFFTFKIAVGWEGAGGGG